MPFLNLDDLTREIYTYNNGVKDVKADPAVLWRKLSSACDKTGETWEGIGEKWRMMSANQDGDTDTQKMANAKGWLELQAIIVGIAYEAFNLHPIDEDGNGVTEAHAMSVLCEFVEDREKKDENTGNLPSTSEPSDGDRTDILKASSSGTNFGTSITMDSTSTSPLPRPSMAPRPCGPSGRPSVRRPTRSSSMPPANLKGTT